MSALKLGFSSWVPNFSSGATAMLDGETQGLAIDFRSYVGQVSVKDTGTVGNNRNNVGVNTWLTNTNASTKWVYGPYGLYVNASANTIAFEYDGTSRYYALIEAAATNLCLWSDDFTNAAWVKTTMIAAKTATGPDGTVSAASTLTATAGNATALQAITSGSASRVTSMFVKRRTGTGVINVTQDNGSTWAAVTVTADWTRVSIVAATLTNPTVGIRIVTSADAIDVQWFQHELTMVTSPIPTTTVTVTRAADLPNVAGTAFPLSQTAGSFVLDVTPYQVAAIGTLAQLDDGTLNERYTLAYDATPKLAFDVVDGGASQASITIGTPAINTRKKAAAAWAVNDFINCFDGTLGTADVAGTLPTPTTLRIGARITTLPFTGRIHSFKYLPRRMTNGELQTATT